MSIVKQFSIRDLEANPITLGVLAILVLTGLCHVMHLEWVRAGDDFVFFKIVIYYLLLVGVVDTPARLRIFLLALACFITILTLIAVLRYTEVIVITVPPTLTKDNAAEKPQENKKPDEIDDGTNPYVAERDFDDRIGEEVVIKRLRGTGIFHDPNDLCLALVFGVLLCLYGLYEPIFGIARVLCLLPMGLFLVALRMTMSRGGLLGLFVGLGVLFACRYGWRRARRWAVVALPIMALMFGGRMTEITTAEGTGQSRLQLWCDGLVEFKTSPVFGVGMGRYQENAGLVAHNSFVHAFTELGFFGGAVFAGHVLLRFLDHASVPTSLCSRRRHRRLLPFMMAILAAYAMGIFTLSRCYEVPTYTMLGLAAAYLRVTPVYPALDRRCTGAMARRVAGVSLVFLLCIDILVRVLAS